MLHHEHFLVKLHQSRNFREFKWVWSKTLNHRLSLTESTTERFSLKTVVRLITRKLYNLIKFLQGGPEPKLSKLATKRIWEKLNMLKNQIHSVIWQMLVKIKKSNFCYLLTSKVCVLNNGVFCDNFFSKNLCLFWLFLKELGLISCIVVLMEFASCSSGCYGNGNKYTVSVIIATIGKGLKQHDKIELTG